MTKKSDDCIVGGIFLLQVLIVPYLSDMADTGKLFCFAFLVLATAVRFFLSADEVRYSRLQVGLLLFCSLLLLSAFQAFRSPWALVQTGVVGLLLLFLLLFVNRAFDSPQLRMKMVDGLLLFGVSAAVLGLYEYCHSILLGPTREMLIPFLLPPNLTWRVGGPYGQPNLFAVLLIVTLLGFFFRFLHQRPELPSRLYALRYLPFILVALNLGLTWSRAGLISIVMVFGFLVWLVASGRYLESDRSARWEMIRLLLCLTAAIIVAKLALEPKDVINSSVFASDPSTDSRFVFWTSAVMIFLERPWLGVGLDGYQFFQNDFGPLAHQFLGFVPYEAMGNTKWAHNELLQILCEGGGAAFILAVLFILILLRMIWKNFVRGAGESEPFFLYSHLLLLPFIIQSMFGWTFRSPPHLFLFFAFLGVLLSQYPLRTAVVKPSVRWLLVMSLVASLGVASFLLVKEVELGTFMHQINANASMDDTFPKFKKLAGYQYTEHRTLSYALPYYAHDALSQDNNHLIELIIPYYERLCSTEGMRGYWYTLALLYLRLDDRDQSKVAINRAIELMPSLDLYWHFLHYLNMLEASQTTGRPLEEFFPQGQKIDLSDLEPSHE